MLKINVLNAAINIEFQAKGAAANYNEVITASRHKVKVSSLLL